MTGNQTLTINAQNPTWYTSNGTATGASAPIINTDNASPQTYKVAQNTNGCLSDQSTITVNIKPKPSPPTVSDPKVLCQFGPTAELTAGGQNLQWFASDDTPLTSPVKPNTDGIASLVFKVVQTVNGCASDKATLTQKINPASDKPTVTPGFYCVGYPAEPISARTPASTQGPKWYQGGSEIAPTTVPKTDQVATFTYQLTQTQADKQGCPSQPVNVVISILATPLAPSVNNLGLCNNRPATVTLDSRVSGQKLTWYETPTGGTGSQTTPKPDVSVVGPKTYYVTQTNEGNCESPRSPLIVTIYPIPAAPKGTVSGPVCQTSGQPQPIGAFASTPDAGGTLTWYWSDQLAGAPQPPLQRHRPAWVLHCRRCPDHQWLYQPLHHHHPNHQQSPQ
ncbi:hypothetical protein HMF3257_28295 [Spirosoma telluris]|uniref:Ig-like domain-containing protein n=1 Tax=Spirosoma telluris TaxID=2183553 RepID=A0A327NR32_9BACT|nr:hypothetical protein HMF3257_28295 [Spirosoma telluris]